jgi:hypothetical protein
MTRSWGPLVAVLLVVGLLAWYDDTLKRGADPGYLPANYDAYLLSHDFPRFCSAMEQTNAGESLLREVPRSVGDLQLAVRQTTGIRATPLRWRLWLGYTLLAGEADGARGICVRPGLLIRLAHGFNRVMGPTMSESGHYRYGPYSYAWHDGYLIVSSSPDYVTASVQASQPDLEAPRFKSEVCLAWRGETPGVVHLEAADDWPVAGHVALDQPIEKASLSLAEAWPESPMLALTTARWQDTQTMLKMLAEPFRDRQPLPRLASLGRSLWADWKLNPLPEDWDATVDQLSVAVMDIDFDDDTPVPELAAILRESGDMRLAEHPLAPLTTGLEQIPYFWTDERDRIVPIMGEPFSLCLSRYDSGWLVASRSSAMVPLAERPAQTAPIRGDVVLHADWNKIGLAAEALLMRLGKWELVADATLDQVERTRIPYAHAVREWGHLRVIGQWERHELHFTGHLAQGGDAS